RMHCQDESRRKRVRHEKDLNGLDYVEVLGDEQTTLHVHFLGRAPDALGPEHLRIEGGRRITGIRVLEVDVDRDSEARDEEFRDESMRVVVDQAGDYSTYVLRVVERDRNGAEIPRTDFDPRYDRVEFSFKASCPSPLDCKQHSTCPPAPRPRTE